MKNYKLISERNFGKKLFVNHPLNYGLFPSKGKFFESILGLQFKLKALFFSFFKLINFNSIHRCKIGAII